MKDIELHMHPFMANIELHVHPFLENNSIVDVVEAMSQRELDVLALESLDASLYPKVVEEMKKHYSSLRIDDAGVTLSNGLHLLNAREYNTKEGLHVLTVGYSMDDATPSTEIRKIIDNGLENCAFVLLDHPFVDNGKTKTAGHISHELEEELVSICKEYSGLVALEWNGYCIPWMRKVLKQGLNLAGVEVKYSDVNKRAEALSQLLSTQGYNVPIVADTDLHARRKRYLQHMGSGRIIASVRGDTARDIVISMKQKIFRGDYVNQMKYVSSAHLIEAFCIPIMARKLFKKPRV